MGTLDPSSTSWFVVEALRDEVVSAILVQSCLCLMRCPLGSELAFSSVVAWVVFVGVCTLDPNSASWLQVSGTDVEDMMGFEIDESESGLANWGNWPQNSCEMIYPRHSARKVDCVDDTSKMNASTGPLRRKRGRLTESTPPRQHF